MRLIGADGINLGVTGIEKAREASVASGLDLVEIVPTAEPPVCRVMDFGKFLFDQNKKRHAAKKKQKTMFRATVMNFLDSTITRSTLDHPSPGQIPTK